MSKPKRYQVPWIELVDIQEYIEETGGIPLILNREYEYLSQPVKLIAMQEDWVLIETRTGERTTISPSELSWRV